MESSAGSQPEANSVGKVRILLQTVTHLVPGNDRGEKLRFIENIVSHHLWKRDYDRAQERMFPYDDYFGLKNRKCFFLIDHHGHDHTLQEEKVPVLWYKWTGQFLIRIDEKLPSKIEKELEKWPFTWEGRKFHRIPKGPDGKYDPIQQRNIIRSFLRLGNSIVETEIEFLKEYPEHAL